MTILSGFQRLLAFIGLNAGQSVEGSTRILVHRMVARFITVTSLFLWVAGEVFSIIQMNEKRFASVAMPFNYALAFGCLLMIYLCLIRKTQQIDDLIEYMENVGSNRKL